MEAISAATPEGEAVHLRCEVRGYRKSDSLPQWSRHGKMLDTNCTKYCQTLLPGKHVVQDRQGRTRISNDTGLLILNVTESDSGEYVCTVDDTSASATLVVEKQTEVKDKSVHLGKPLIYV